MNRSQFLKSLTMIPFAASAMKLNVLAEMANKFSATEKMPVLFVGHGSPMNAIEDNRFSKGMKEIAAHLPKPKAILMVSAHWETKGSFVTINQQPKTIHDFGGFPQALFDVQYPAPGSKWLAEETKNAVTTAQIGFDDTWGFDHGCWSVTRNMFPDANIPIIQLSLDNRQPATYHYELAKQLISLRNKGVLIIGSGNMVHNFRYLQIRGKDFNETFGHDWALQANEQFKKLILDNDFKSLSNYQQLGKHAQLAVPTAEHYLPMLYAIAQRDKKDNVTFFNDAAIGGSFTMTSVLIK